MSMDEHVLEKLGWGPSFQEAWRSRAWCLERARNEDLVQTARGANFLEYVPLDAAADRRHHHDERCTNYHGRNGQR